MNLQTARMANSLPHCVKTYHHAISPWEQLQHLKAGDPSLVECGTNHVTRLCRQEGKPSGYKHFFSLGTKLPGELAF